MAEIDRLEVRVQSNAAAANRQLDKLVLKLMEMKSALNGINGSGLGGLANSVKRFADASQGLGNVKTSDFTRLVKNIEKVSNINTSQLNKSASAINTMVMSINRIGDVSENSVKIAELAKGIAKLGGKNVQTAITNMPALANAIRGMMRTLATAPRVSENIIRMTNALADLSSKGSRVGTAAGGISNGFRNYSNSARTATKSSKSLASAMGSLWAKYYLIYRGVQTLGKAIVAATDYIEEYNYFNVTMGKIASEWSKNFKKYGYESAEAYAESFQGRLTELLGKMTGFKMNDDGTLSEIRNIANLGLDITSLVNYAAGLNQVTNSLGLTGEASVITSKALTMLAGDMSSFRNLDLKEVMDNFQSGLIGQSRALYKYGIDITNATLKEYAYTYGIKKKISAMSQSEKMQLRVLAILDQSKVAYGDLANTIQSPSNQLRLLKNNFVALGRTIGELFLPMVAKVLPYINALVIAIRRLFSWIGGLIGIDMSSVIGNSSAGYTDAFDDLSDSAEDSSDAIDKANSSAKKLKRTIMGFDELNILSDPSSGSSKKDSGSGGGGIDLTDELNSAMAEYESVWNKAFNNMNNTATQFADNIGKKLEPVRKSIEKLWTDGFAKFGDFSFGTLSDFYNDFLVPIGNWSMTGEGLPRFFNITNDLMNKIDWDKLRKSLDGLYKALVKPTKITWKSLMDFYEYFLSPLADWAMSEALPRLANILTKMAKNIKWDEMNKNLREFWKAIEPYAESFGEGLIDFFEDAADIATETINKLFGKDGVLSQLTNALNDNDPENARQWGYSLAILFATFTGLKIAKDTMTTLAALKSFITGVAPFMATGGGFLITVTLVGTATAWATALNLLDRYENGTPEEKKEIETGWKNNEENHPLNKRYKQMQESSDWWTGYKDNSPTRDQMKESSSYWSNWFGGYKDNSPMREHMIGSSEEWDKTFEKLKSSVEKWPAKLEKWWGNVKLSVGNKYETTKSNADSWFKNLKTWWGAKQLSIKNKFDTIASNVGDWFKSVQGWWGERKLSIKNKFDTMSSEISSWYTNVKTWWGDRYLSVKNKFATTESTIQAWANDVKTWWSKNIPDLSDIGKKMMSSIITGFKSISLPKFKFTIDKSVDSGSLNFLEKTMVAAFGGMPKISLYANGGFPSVGEMFVARERGPELVGTMGGRSAVANNSQIEAGIEDAAYRGMTRAIRESGSGNQSAAEPVIEQTIYMGDEVVMRSVKRAQKKASRRYQTVTSMT